MKFVLVLALALAVSAAPQGDKDTQIVKSDYENPGDGSYKFNYALSDGTTRDESGNLKRVGDVDAQTAEGTISWTSPEGQVITLRFVADENGYQPQGDHLPK
ncbi:larval cuticle protein LCP-17 [Folsomia candida]|uniref:Larval cuticle protein LCP-17 n=1 Tax=Folsomia candida TaxID=158441 RepID=A0A226DWW2_FOLCA|nr:larval cuticle protein LCP-17 [Folsomia candida]OXA49962.1 Larval cuticle protein LCP-17 [Folsomia candida]